jgi:benzoate membrane transport protein
MLAGVLLPLCLAPVRSVVELPLLTAPVIITWVLLTRIDRRWSVPAALVVAAIAIAIDRPLNMGLDDLAPQLTFTVPELHVRAIIGLAIPLFVVTMASQNIPGVSVLATYGYRPDLRPLLTTTGAATMVGAPFGAHTVSLAAITAAMVAGPAVHADPDRRWIASVTSGAMYVVLGLCAGAATVLIAAAPPVLIECVAGLALLGALGAALTTALADAERREAAMVTFVISASGISALGIGGSFWGLVAGLAFLALHRTGRTRVQAAS